MEARNRAIASKSRAGSPAPHSNGRSHRRDRSSGPAETRFPIQTSPTNLGEGHRKAAVRASLEVPASQAGSPVLEKYSAPLSSSHVQSANRNSIPENEILQDEPSASRHDDGGTQNVLGAPEGGVNGGFTENREPSTRPPRYPARKNVARGSLGDEGGLRPVGVQLSDKPMDD